MTIDPKAAKTIADLIRELSSEVDLHHEDSELPATRRTIDTLKDAAKFLRDHGVVVPEVVDHIVGRYNQAVGRGQ